MADPAPWRVSAVMPAFNRAEFLLETIGSVLRQESPVHEVIVVDDGSTDNTETVIARFGDLVRCVRTENRGAPAARNTGASLATGDWLWFCDSDDLWHPQYLSRCRQVAESEHRPEFLFGNFLYVRDGVWDATDKFSTAPDPFWQAIEREAVAGGEVITVPFYAALLRFQPVFPSTMVMSKAFFDRTGGFDESLGRTASEDLEFVLRCAAYAPTGMISDALVGIRRHAGNFSGNQLRTLLGEIHILEHAKRHHAAAVKLESEIEGQIVHRTLQALALAFSKGEYPQVRALAQALPRGRLDAAARGKAIIAGLPSALRSCVIGLSHLRRRPAV